MGRRTADKLLREHDLACKKGANIWDNAIILTTIFEPLHEIADTKGAITTLQIQVPAVQSQSQLLQLPKEMLLNILECLKYGSFQYFSATAHDPQVSQFQELEIDRFCQNRSPLLLDNKDLWDAAYGAFLSCHQLHKLMLEVKKSYLVLHSCSHPRHGWRHFLDASNLESLQDFDFRVCLAHVSTPSDLITNFDTNSFPEIGRILLKMKQLKGVALRPGLISDKYRWFNAELKVLEDATNLDEVTAYVQTFLSGLCRNVKTAYMSIPGRASSGLISLPQLGALQNLSLNFYQKQTGLTIDFDMLPSLKRLELIGNFGSPEKIDFEVQGKDGSGPETLCLCYLELSSVISKLLHGTNRPSKIRWIRLYSCDYDTANQEAMIDDLLDMPQLRQVKSARCSRGFAAIKEHGLPFVDDDAYPTRSSYSSEEE